MNSKTKLFSKGLIKADLKRFWVSGVIYAGLIFLTTFFALYLDKGAHISFDGRTYAGSMLYSYALFSNFSGVLFGGILAAALFSFLKSESAVSFYHGLPQSRGKIFRSKLLSAAALLILPVLANAALVIFTKICGSGVPVRYIHVLIWAGIQIVYSFIAFSLITLIASFTGNIFSLLLIGGACLVAPGLILGFLDEMGSLYLLGYEGNLIEKLEYIYLTPYIMASRYILIYIILAALFLLAAFFIYKARPLERCGEALTFKTAKVIFIYAAALLGGIISYWYFSIWFDRSIFFMLPFGIVSIIIANMINQKSITIKKAPLYTGIFILAVLLIYGLFKIDFTGFEKRMPSADKIEGVMIYSDNPYIANPNDYISYQVKGFATEKENLPDFYLTDKKEIEDVLNYHKFKIEEEKRNGSIEHICIEYKLSGGKTLLRRYSFNKNADKEYFEAIAGTDTLKRQRYDIYKNSEKNIVSFEVHPSSSELYDSPYVTVSPDSKTFTDLYNALQKDIENLSYDDDASLGVGGARATAVIDVSGDGNINYVKIQAVPGILITEGFTETNKILDRFKFSAEGYTPECITKIETNGSEITDKAQILEIAGKVKYSFENNLSGNDLYYFYFENGDSFAAE
ncbi:MAG: hypothetical protein J5590_01885 [Clostridia bacterium]|nr:hypothetical protein [Clostridia bacterium]